MNVELVYCFVEGHPEHQGNLVPIGRGRPGVRDKNAKHLHPWRDHVALRVREAYGGHPLDQPLELDVTFYFDRPASHYGSGRNATQLKRSAPAVYRTTRPDIDKLLRAILDALTGVVWSDDSRVVQAKASKRWNDGRPEGATIIVRHAL